MRRRLLLVCDCVLEQAFLRGTRVMASSLITILGAQQSVFVHRTLIRREMHVDIGVGRKSMEKQYSHASAESGSEHRPVIAASPGLV